MVTSLDASRSACGWLIMDQVVCCSPCQPCLACSTAHSCVSKVHHKTLGGQRIALPQRRTDRFASPDLGFWFDEGIPYDPPYDHLQTAAIFDMCCNQSVVMSDNLASALGRPSPAPPALEIWQASHAHTHTRTHGTPRQSSRA